MRAHGNLVATDLDESIPEGEVRKKTFYCDLNDTDGGEDYDIQNGITYEVKVIADDNTQVSFSVKAQSGS